jgi:hypothetical protein
LTGRGRQAGDTPHKYPPNRAPGPELAADGPSRLRRMLGVSGAFHG